MGDPIKSLLIHILKDSEESSKFLVNFSNPYNSLAGKDGLLSRLSLFHVHSFTVDSINV